MESNVRPKTIIGEDVEITGSIKSESNIQLDGKLNGDMTCAGEATIGNTSVIKGNLTVECVTDLHSLPVPQAELVLILQQQQVNIFQQ